MDKIELLTGNEMAEMWRVTPQTISNWRKKGFLPYVKVDGTDTVRYPKDENLELYRKSYHKPTKNLNT